MTLTAPSPPAPSRAAAATGSGSAATPPRPAVREPAVASEATAAPQTPEFTDLYAQHFAFVWRTLSRLGVVDAELEDVAQEVFVVVHRKLADYDPSRPIKPWLVGIAARVGLAERRRARHRRESLQPDPAQRATCARPAPDAALEVRERRERVRTALLSLDEPRRIVFVMHCLEGLGCPDIAEALGVPLNTVYSRLRVAREQFAAAMTRLRLQEGVA